MRFRSERDQQLAIEVIRQMVALVDSLLDAVCMQYLAHQYFNVDPRRVLWVTREALPKLHDTLKAMVDTLVSGGR